MKFYDFSKFLIKYQNIDKLPNKNLYKDEIVLPSDLWKELTNLHKFTKNDNKEYTTSLFWADSTPITTPPKSGSESEVFSNHQVSMKYVPKTDTLAERHIFIDGKVSKKVPLKMTQIPKQPAVHLLFNIHTHPPQKFNNNKGYSFFSTVDLNTLIRVPFLCMGLITDELLLICKHDASPQMPKDINNSSLQNINRNYFTNKSLPPQEQFGFVIYRGGFNKKLQKSG